MSIKTFFSRFSIQKILNEAAHTIRRFPLPLLALFAATIMGIVAIEIEKYDYKSNLLDTLALIILVTTLGATLLAAAATLAESQTWSLKKTYLLQFGIVILLILYYITLPAIGEFLINHATRHAVFQLCAIILFVLAPFLKPLSTQGLWQYAKTLFIRLVLTGIFSGVLFGGLALALWSFEFLFEIDIRSQRYGEIGVIIAGIFAPLLFLSGVPRRFQELEKDTSYPHALRSFTVYILTPLLLLFTLILYGYLGKILITSEWPEGGVAHWILAYCVYGVITFLLMRPLNDIKWVKRLFTILFLLYLPLITVLFLALSLRVNQYGFTEERLYVGILGAWLIPLALYLALSKKRMIGVVPLSFVIIAIIFMMGPWSVFAISKRSQADKLETLLNVFDMYRNGTLYEPSINAREHLTPEDCESMQSTFYYLQDRTIDGTFIADETFREKLRQLIDDACQGKNAHRFGPLRSNHVSFSTPSEQTAIIELARYEYAFPLEAIYNNDKKTISLPNKQKLIFNPQDDAFRILLENKEIASLDLHGFLAKLSVKEDYNYRMPNESMILITENENAKAALHVRRIDGEKNSRFVVTSLSGLLLLTIK